MSSALTTSQLALAREQQLSAFGGHAAAAAHELGTPLGTIAVVSRELAREAPPGSPMEEDIRLLIEQSERCRQILAELGRGPVASVVPQDTEMTLDALVQAAAERHAVPRIQLRFDAAPDASCPDMLPPPVSSCPEVVHGIGNLVDNAIRFAQGEVVVATRWSADRWQVSVTDDGPGIAPRLIPWLGEPYPPSQEADDGRMGLGVFIARTMLERTGAQLSFANRPPLGLEATVTWAPPPSAWPVAPADANVRQKAA